MKVKTIVFFLAILAIAMLAFMPAPVHAQAIMSASAPPITVDWGQILTQILAFVLPILLLALLPLVIAKIANAIADFKQRYPKWAWLLDLASQLAVDATEQAKKSGLIEKTAKAAQDYALQVAQNYLHAHHIDGIDVALILNSNEAALWKYINSSKPVRVAVPPIKDPATQVITSDA